MHSINLPRNLGDLRVLAFLQVYLITFDLTTGQKGIAFFFFRPAPPKGCHWTLEGTIKPHQKAPKIGGAGHAPCFIGFAFWKPGKNKRIIPNMLLKRSKASKNHSKTYNPRMSQKSYYENLLLNQTLSLLNRCQPAAARPCQALTLPSSISRGEASTSISGSAWLRC